MKMKTLGSYPGAGAFRSVSVVIISMICAVAFLYKADEISLETEKIAKQQVIINIKNALAIQLYDYAIKRKLADLPTLHRENPFIPLAIYRSLPSNYYGAVGGSADIQNHGWYFDLSKRRIIYRYFKQRLPDEKFEMLFKFDDFNENGVYENNELGFLEIKRA